MVGANLAVCPECGSRWIATLPLEIHTPGCPRSSSGEADAQRQRERAAYEWQQRADPVLRELANALDAGPGTYSPCDSPDCVVWPCVAAKRIRALLEAEHDR